MVAPSASLDGAVSLGPRAPAVFISSLGSFRVLKSGEAVSLKTGGKAECLLSNLALGPRLGLHRDQVLSLLWPGGEPALSGQSLNTLTYSLHRQLGDALEGRPPIVLQEGHYRLNAEGGVEVDVAAFDAAADAGDRATRTGDVSAAFASYRRATGLYHGDLVVSTEVRHVVERERLRARYLEIRARLVDLRFQDGDYVEALAGALELLNRDPCREDAHRLVMRCYNRLGQRAQALRQYQVCRQVLAAEFDAVPEPATDRLYEQLRTDPSLV